MRATAVAALFAACVRELLADGQTSGSCHLQLHGKGTTEHSVRGLSSEEETEVSDDKMESKVPQWQALAWFRQSAKT
eukprot:Skav219511  [mRNA]  locus=scaffold3561:121882:122578:+ [translate_table: standard]